MNRPSATTKLGNAKAKPAFIAKAERAFKRVARNVRAESRRAGLPVLVWTEAKSKTGSR